jgi:hypothetical protein
MFDQIERLARAKNLTMTCYIDDICLSGRALNGIDLAGRIKTALERSKEFYLDFCAMRSSKAYLKDFLISRCNLLGTRGPPIVLQTPEYPAFVRFQAKLAMMFRSHRNASRLAKNTLRVLLEATYGSGFATCLK